MIEVRYLRKTFKTQTVLDGVSFQIENGESVAIIGRSGGGKVRASWLKHPRTDCCSRDSPEVLIDGENIVGMNERQLLRVRRKFGMLFQGSALFDSMTVAENVAFGLRRLGNFDLWQKLKKVVCYALEVVDLPGTQNKRAGRANCPARMKKRVGLARARLSMSRKSCLYDEPTTGLEFGGIRQH